MTVHGTVPAIPTPLTAGRSLDEHALERLLARIFGAGAEGVVALGTSGEGMSLDTGRRRAVLRATGSWRGNGTLVAGCAGNSVRTVLEAIDEAAEEAFDAALVPAPFYYPASDSALRSFYHEVASAAALPVILYHIPARTKNQLTPEGVRELALADNVVGIKDSGGDALFHLELLATQHEGFAVMQGVAPLAAWSYLHGARGAITPVSALHPEAELGVRRAVAAGDLAELRQWAGRMNDVARLFRLNGLPLVSNLKAMGELLGICPRWTEPPIPTADDKQLLLLRQQLAELEWDCHVAGSSN